MQSKEDQKIISLRNRPGSDRPVRRDDPRRFSFRASPEGRIGVSIYTGEGCHLGGIIGIPWSGSETGFGVHVAAIRSFFVVFAAVVPAVGVAAGCVRGAHQAPAVE